MILRMWGIFFDLRHEEETEDDDDMIKPEDFAAQLPGKLEAFQQWASKQGA